MKESPGSFLSVHCSDSSSGWSSWIEDDVHTTGYVNKTDPSSCLEVLDSHFRKQKEECGSSSCVLLVNQRSFEFNTKGRRVIKQPIESAYNFGETQAFWTSCALVRGVWEIVYVQDVFWKSSCGVDSLFSSEGREKALEVSSKYGARNDSSPASSYSVCVGFSWLSSGAYLPDRSTGSGKRNLR